MAASAQVSHMERPELGFESMNHFTIDTDDLAVMLMNIDFCSADDDEDDAEEGEEDSEHDPKY